MLLTALPEELLHSMTSHLDRVDLQNFLAAIIPFASTLKTANNVITLPVTSNTRYVVKAWSSHYQISREHWTDDGWTPQHIHWMENEPVADKGGAPTPAEDALVETKGGQDHGMSVQECVGKLKGWKSERTPKLLAHMIRSNKQTLTTTYWTEKPSRGRSLMDLANNVLEIEDGESKFCALLDKVQSMQDRGQVRDVKAFVSRAIWNMSCEQQTTAPQPPSSGNARPSYKLLERPKAQPVHQYTDEDLQFVVVDVALRVVRTDTYSRIKDEEGSKRHACLTELVAQVAGEVHPYVDFRATMRLKFECLSQPSQVPLGTVPVLLKDRRLDPVRAAALYVNFVNPEDKLPETESLSAMRVMEAYPEWRVFRITFDPALPFTPAKLPYTICQLGAQSA